MCRKSDASGNPVFPRTNSDRRFFSVRMGKTRNRKIIAAAALILSAGTMSCEKRQREPESREALGTVCSVNLYESGTESKYGKIFARLDEIDALFNLSSPASDISRVNAARGAPVEVAPDFIKVLSEALEIARVTEGAFNPALGSVTELWRNAKIHTDRIPSKTEIRNALAHADFRKIRLDEQAGTVCMGDAEAKLDLNAIAKGFAADSIAEILAQGNVKGATVNLGGHIYVFGTKKDRSPWKLGIKNPNAPEGIPAVSVRPPVIGPPGILPDPGNVPVRLARFLYGCRSVLLRRGFFRSGCFRLFLVFCFRCGLPGTVQAGTAPDGFFAFSARKFHCVPDAGFAHLGKQTDQFRFPRIAHAADPQGVRPFLQGRQGLFFQYNTHAVTPPRPPPPCHLPRNVLCLITAPRKKRSLVVSW